MAEVAAEALAEMARSEREVGGPDETSGSAESALDIETELIELKKKAGGGDA